MPTTTKSDQLLIAEKWAKQWLGDVDAKWRLKGLTNIILSVITEATEQQAERIAEFYTGLVVKESMAVGETKFCCREAIEEMKRLGIAPEQSTPPTENRPESEEGVSKGRSRCTCSEDGYCDSCKLADLEVPQYADLEQQSHEQQDGSTPEDKE